MKTVSDFAKKMKDMSEMKECFTNRHIRTLLEQKYGSSVSFKCHGKENLILFGNQTESIETNRAISLVGSLLKN